MEIGVKKTLFEFGLISGTSPSLEILENANKKIKRDTGLSVLAPKVPRDIKVSLKQKQLAIYDEL